MSRSLAAEMCRLQERLRVLQLLSESEGGDAWLPLETGGSSETEFEVATGCSSGQPTVLVAPPGLDAPPGLTAVARGRAADPGGDPQDVDAVSTVVPARFSYPVLIPRQVHTHTGRAREDWSL